MIKYTYDDNGILRKEEKYNSDGSLSVRYVYNERGDEESSEVYANDNELIASDVHIYDKNGYLLAIITTDIAFSRVSRTEYAHYDEHGGLLSEELDRSQNVPEGELSDTLSFIYDSNGNVLSMTSYDPYRVIVELIKSFTYDENGNLLSMRTTGGREKESQLFYSATYICDADGNILIETEYSAITGEISAQSEYTYDEYSNVLSVTRYDKDGVISGMKERVYENIVVPLGVNN